MKTSDCLHKDNNEKRWTIKSSLIAPFEDLKFWIIAAEHGSDSSIKVSSTFCHIKSALKRNEMKQSFRYQKENKR